MIALKNIKKVVSVCLAALSVVHCVILHHSGDHVYLAVSAGRATVAVANAVLVGLEHSRDQIRSHLLFVFWLVATGNDALRLIMAISSKKYSHDLDEFFFILLSGVFTFLMFLLNCVSDSRRQFCNTGCTRVQKASEQYRLVSHDAWRYFRRSLQAFHGLPRTPGHRQALRMRQNTKHGCSVGEIVNLMSVDTKNLELFLVFSCMAWSGLFHLTFGAYLCYTVSGVSMMTAVRHSLGDREVRGLIPGRVKPRTLKLVLAADPPSVWHYGFSAKSGRPGVRMMGLGVVSASTPYTTVWQYAFSPQRRL
ncbi:ATP-binding cassette sub-family C ABCC/MRP-like protein [Elysia marginata]|uniref:ATP-binding cassette sub-family C ABCC/MRP-like protein n=1 Tax=Elysia marginata TaxID=1093978 RepID=A0AAV4JGB2_9GAST|nr:ATP-binding cassette sub-family C ABCC/MRP-like protein [Elysia marginata]